MWDIKPSTFNESMQSQCDSMQAFRSATSFEREYRARKARQEEEQFAVWDYDPGILSITSCAVSVGCGITAIYVLLGLDDVAGSDRLRFVNFLLLAVQSIFCAVAVLMLKVRGRHVRYLVRNYQRVTASFMIFNFYLGLAHCAVRERRQAGSFGSLSTCIVAGYTMALSAMRLKWEWVVILLVIDILGAVIMGLSTGLPSACMQRIVFAVGLGGTIATYLSFNRITHSRLQFQSLQRIRAVATRNAEFLCTLIPSRVVERAFVSKREESGSGSAADPHGIAATASGEGGEGGGRTGGPSQIQKRKQNQLLELSTWDADTPQLELQENLHDIVVMFCSLPPLSMLGNDLVAFRKLNDIFSAFDDEVRNFKMFKYHHVFNTYIVASPAAALRHSSYKNRIDEHAGMLALAVRLKHIASEFTAANGDPLWLAIGLDCGNMVGKIVGSEKSFWCLFGQCINIAARLSARSGRDRLYLNNIAVSTPAVAEKLQTVRQKIIEGSASAQERSARKTVPVSDLGAAGGGLTSASDSERGDGPVVSDNSRDGLPPGFQIVELGVQPIKGHGDMLLYVVRETGSTAGNTPEHTSGSEGACDTDISLSYSKSFTRRARAALTGGHFRGLSRSVGRSGSGRFGGSGGRKRNSFQKTSGEPMDRLMEGVEEIEAQGAGQGHVMTFKAIAERWNQAKVNMPSDSDSDSDAPKHRRRPIMHWARGGSERSLKISIPNDLEDDSGSMSGTTNDEQEPAHRGRNRSQPQSRAQTRRTEEAERADEAEKNEMTDRSVSNNPEPTQMSYADEDAYEGDIGGLPMTYRRPFRQHYGQRAVGNSSDSEGTSSDAKPVLSPRSLLLFEAEKVRSEAILQARAAFRNLGVRKLSNLLRRGGTLKKVAEHSSYTASAASSSKASSRGSLKSTTTTPSPSGSQSSLRDSWRKRRSQGSKSGSRKSASGSFRSRSQERQEFSSSQSTEDMCDMAGSFTSLLNESFKRSLLFEDSFKLEQLEKVLDTQFPVQRKEVISSSDDQSSDARRAGCRAARPSWLNLRRPMSHFKSRGTWIDRISSNSRNTNGGSYKSGTSSSRTQSSTSRLLSGEIEWFQDDSTRNVNGEMGSDISFGSSYFRRGDWQERDLMRNTYNSQCLEGFGRGGSRGNSPAPSLSASFNSSISKLFRTIIMSSRAKPGHRLTHSGSERWSDTETGAVHNKTFLTSEGERRSDTESGAVHNKTFSTIEGEFGGEPRRPGAGKHRVSGAEGGCFESQTGSQSGPGSISSLQGHRTGKRSE